MNKLKRLSIFALAIFMASFFVPYSVDAASEVDQACDVQDIQDPEDVGYWKIRVHNETSQTFRPTVDKLTSVIVAVGGEAGARLDLSVVDVATGEVMVSRLAVAEYFQAQWVEFKFDNPVTLDTTKQYKIRVTSSYLDVYWYVATIPCYANGYAIVDGSAEAGQDFGFATYGYDSTPPPENPPAEDPSGSEASNDGESTQQESSESDNKIAEVDESVATPEITSVTVNGEEVEVSDAALELNDGDKVTIKGTSDGGDKVVVIWGLKSYETDVSDDGTWSIDLTAKDSEGEELLVQGQAKKDSKGSEKTDFFKVSVAAAEAGAVARAVNQDNSNSMIMVYVWLGLAALVAVSSGVGGYYYFKKKKIKKPKPSKKE